jgi:hypothetical protein
MFWLTDSNVCEAMASAVRRVLPSRGSEPVMGLERPRDADPRHKAQVAGYPALTPQEFGCDQLRATLRA